MKFWTPAEDKILKEMYWDQNAEDIRSALPGRTWYSITSRAVRLELRRKFIHAGREKSKRTTDKRVMDAVIAYDHKFGFGPTRIEVHEATGISYSTVHGSVERLIERGLLIRHPGRSRAIGLAPALRRRLLEREMKYRDRVKQAA